MGGDLVCAGAFEVVGGLEVVAGLEVVDGLERMACYFGEEGGVLGLMVLLLG